ncbi:MAG: type II secretion system protein N [Roseovarius sp.]|uniref:type II secretion system protein N n=2 Tax=Roseovarius sp. TaxID=1486281 RepID=UPI0032EE2052
MMRFVLILLGLLTGLGLAVLSEGRMSHLRLVAPQLAPVWTAPIDGGATLWQGQAQGLSLGVLPGPTDLRWRFDRVERAGIVWSIRLNGAGVDARGEMRLPWSRDRVALRDVSGDLGLADLPAIIGGAVQTGLLRVEGLRAEIGLPERQLLSLAAQIEMTGGRFGPVEIGSGEAILTSDQAGGWRMPFSVEGAMLRAEGRFEGALGRPGARLELQVTETNGLSQEARRVLDRVAEPKEGGWRLTRDIDSLGAWPVF